MKGLPEVDVSFAPLYTMLLASIKSKLLLTAIDLKVFNYLSEPESASAVAKAIRGHPHNTEVFLDGLTACDLLKKRNSLYQNTTITQTFLVEGSSTYLGEFFVNQMPWYKPVLDSLSTLIMKGPSSQSQIDGESEHVCAQWVGTQANYERSGIAQSVAEIIQELPEFPSFQRMLDLGGGPGIIGMAIVAAHPTMRGVLFDRPFVAKAAETYIREYDMQERIEVMGGDFKSESIGEGYDLVLASASLNFVKPAIDSVLKKIYDALNSGGVFVSIADGLTNEGTKPEIMKIGWLSMQLMGQDMAFERGFVANSMRRVGFKSLDARTLDAPMGPMDLDIGRK